MAGLREKFSGLKEEDLLTGVLNRHAGFNKVNKYIDRNPNTQCAFMIFDGDNFKKINDNYGHSVGDATLKALADMLKSFAQDKHASVGRWGGEEFVTVLSGVSDDEALEYAEDLRKTVAAADFGEAGHITCSVGISQLGDDDSFDDLFNRMDKAMYSSKTAGRNRVTVL